MRRSCADLLTAACAAVARLSPPTYAPDAIALLITGDVAEMVHSMENVWQNLVLPSRVTAFISVRAARAEDAHCLRSLPAVARILIRNDSASSSPRNVDERMREDHHPHLNPSGNAAEPYANGVGLFKGEVRWRSVLEMWRRVHEANLLRELHEAETGVRYSFVLRVRADIEFDAPIDVRSWALAPHVLYQPPCGQWRDGVNDQFFAGLPAAMTQVASLYFSIPHLYKDHNTSFHPETLLASHAQHQGLAVRTMSLPTRSEHPATSIVDRLRWGFGRPHATTPSDQKTATSTNRVGVDGGTHACGLNAACCFKLAMYRLMPRQRETAATCLGDH